MKVCMAVFQLKGRDLLWWKTLRPQLNMVVEDVSWEMFEEWYWERYLPEEFGIDWLESHDVIINCKTRRLSLTDDKGQRRVIVGRNHRVSPWFISSLQIQKIMHKGFKLYSILMKNDKGEAEELENPLVV
jgi:hypothetical protein